jgi:hypothetical protein
MLLYPNGPYSSLNPFSKADNRAQPDWAYELPDWTPKFVGQVLPDWTKSGVTFINILHIK